MKRLSLIAALSSVLLLSQADAARLNVTPVQKVIDLLTGLQTQVKEQGVDAAKAYDKVACSCKDGTSKLKELVAADSAKIESSTARVNQHTANAQSLAQEIGAHQEQVAKDSAKLDRLKKDREAAEAEFVKAHKELSDAISAVLRAHKRVESSQATPENPFALTQTEMTLVQSLAGPVDFKKRFSDSAYDFHSGSVLELLTSLKTKFVQNLNEVELQEAKEKDDFIAESTALTNSIHTNTENISTKAASKAEQESKLARAKADLHDAQNAFKQDSTGLADITATCELAGRKWEDHTKTRAGELEAIAKALAVLSGKVADLEHVNISSEFNTPHASLLAKAAHSFLQVAAKRRGPSGANEVVEDEEESKGKQRALETLLERAKALKSATLLDVAMKIEGDPFKKVKGLIKQLLDRLLEEANGEAEHKGWCDSNIAENTKKRDYSHQAMAKLQARIESTSARKAQRLEGIAALNAAIASLSDNLAKVTNARDAERKQNTQTVLDAKSAAQAVEEARVILADYYKQAANAGVSLLQTEPGFHPTVESPTEHNDRALADYKGQQGAASSIVAVLETIRDNFKATASQTETDEKEAERAFNKYKTDTLSDVAGKQMDAKNYDEEVSQCSASISADSRDLAGQKEINDAALAELEKLRLSCTDQGMSWKQRSNRRKQEIEALKQAYGFLGGEARDWGEFREASAPAAPAAAADHSAAPADSHSTESHGENHTEEHGDSHGDNHGEAHSLVAVKRSHFLRKAL